MLPFILIAKAVIAVSAGNGFLEESQFQDYLKKNKNYPVQFLVDSAYNLLIALHSILILLQASNRDFISTDVKNPADPTKTIKKQLMEVAAFTPDYLDSENAQGILSQSKQVIINVDNIPLQSNIKTQTQEIYPEYLNTCFSQLASLPGNFQIKECLAECLKSVPPGMKHPEALKEALTLIHFILSSADLDQARAWLKVAPPSPVTQTQKWLNQSLDLDDTLWNKLNAVNDPDAKRVLRQIEVMLDWSGRFHMESIKRLDNDNNGNDIKTEISTITGNLSDAEKEHWKNLQAALFGALSWHVFTQARYAASQVHLLV